ncbi:metal ABC transporter ATP-binding protein [Roseomonas acroporae]|uniref:metal ABC transporter ATP-binding protein n=1 Tax=Roseomonas acroporae TaxID=2937791 RepID=UPI0031F55B9E
MPAPAIALTPPPGPAHGPPALAVRDLTLSHGGQVAVRGLSGCFAPGSLTAVVGPNGAGKTTLLQALAGLHRPAAGTVSLSHPARIALLPQAATLDRGFPIACLDVVELGHWSRLGPFRRVTPALRQRSRAALAAVGLEGHERRPIGSLSGGQMQRLLFARLLVQDAPVILLDEPFNAVDARTLADLLSLLRRWHGEGRTVVAVLHDLDLVRHAFPETLLLACDCLGWGATAEVLTPANRRRARMARDWWAGEPWADDHGADDHGAGARWTDASWPGAPRPGAPRPGAPRPDASWPDTPWPGAPWPDAPWPDDRRAGDHGAGDRRPTGPAMPGMPAPPRADAAGRPHHLT